MSTIATTKYIWFNGEIVEWDKAQVHVMTHALHYGSSVFEGIRAYDTKEGTKIFRLDEHIKRLFNSAKIYWMNIPYTQDEIKEACAKVLSVNNLKSGYLRPLAFIGNVGLGVMPKSDKVEVMIGAVPWELILVKRAYRMALMFAFQLGIVWLQIQFLLLQRLVVITYHLY